MLKFLAQFFHKSDPLTTVVQQPNETVKETDSCKLYNLLESTGSCPDCGGEDFLEGPSGGMSVNISCEKCGTRFNLTPLLRRVDRI
jgi:tRNA(Ile2) C34 agmatinyltransferase TiaS